MLCAAPAGPAGPASAHPQARAATSVATTAIEVAQRPALLASRLGVSPRNVQHNLELQQRSSRGDGIGPLSGVRLDSRTAGPRLERFFRLPLRDDEVAVFALDRPQQLKAQETGLIVDGVRTVREPLLQLWTGVRRDLDCVDLHHGHAAKATACTKTVRATYGSANETASRRLLRAVDAEVHADFGDSRRHRHVHRDG